MFSTLANNTQAYLLYLLYGASFLYLAVSIVAKDMKGSDLKIAGILWPLAVFAFLHGFSEWLELGHLLDGPNAPPGEISAVKEAMAFLSIASYLFLLQFGSTLVGKTARSGTRFIQAIPAFLFALWALYLFYCERGNNGFVVIDIDFLREAKIGARLLFGLPGSLLSAFGLIAYSREIKSLSDTVGKKIYFAGVAFVFYGLFTAVLSKGFPLPMLRVPAELLRGISALFITYFAAGSLAIFDIEKRKRFEQQTRRLVQAEKLASLGQLAAGIAHEINNPLANASLGIETIRRRLSTPEGSGPDALEKLDAVERNIDRASVIARELLHFSRQHDSGHVPVNVNRVIEGVLTLMRHKLRDRTVLKELGPVPNVLGDAGKLEQVFINIVSNSVEAMPEGGTIAITTTTDGEKVVTKVSDTGGGIRPEDIGKVFDPFFTTKEIGSGTGLGLYISYGIIAQHNGEIEIASTAGRGTTLTVTIPAEKS